MARTFLELYRQKAPKIQNWKHIKSLISNFGESFIPFLVNVSVLPTEKTENHRFSGNVRRYKMGTMAREWVKLSVTNQI